jgi:hypothetical protein
VGPEGGFPLDSANEVLARLGVTHRPVGNDNEHEGPSDKTRELPETALTQVLTDALNFSLDPMLPIKRRLLFTETFAQFLTRPSPNALTQFALDLVNAEFKVTSENLVQCGQEYMGGVYDFTTLEVTIKNFEWLLNILLQNGVAKEAVESMVHQENDDFMTVLHYIFNPFFLLHPDMVGGRAPALQQFAEIVCSIFVEVAQGRILLTVDSRFTLIQEFSWLMLHMPDMGSARWNSTKMAITELIGNLPLLDQASMFENLQTHHESQSILDEAYNNWFHRVMHEHDAEMSDS